MRNTLICLAAILFCASMLVAQSAKESADSATPAPAKLKKKEIGDINLDALTTEFQKSVEPTPGMNVVWYMPAEYWQVIAETTDEMTQKQKKDMTEAMNPYFILAIIRSDISSLGTFRFHSKERVQRSLNVKYIGADGKEKVLRPLEKLNDEAAVLLDMMTPILARAMGNLGENLHFYAFEDTDGEGNRTVSPYEKGKLVVELAKTPNETGGIMEFDLPADSLHEPRICTKCSKKQHVSWNFCPWCGVKL